MDRILLKNPSVFLHGDIILTHWGQIKSGPHFEDDIFKFTHILLYENYCVLIEISTKFTNVLLI